MALADITQESRTRQKDSTDVKVGFCSHESSVLSQEWHLRKSDGPENWLEMKQYLEWSAALVRMQHNKHKASCTFILREPKAGRFPV